MIKKVIFYFLAYVFIQIVVGGVMGGVTAALADNAGIQISHAMSIILSSAVSNILAFAAFIGCRWMPASLNYIKSRPWTDLYWCALLTLGMLIPSQALEELIPESLRTDILADVMKGVMSTAWGYIAVGLLAPLVEEIVFRGAIQGALQTGFAQRGKSHWYAIVVTSLLFAAIHGNPAQMPHAFLIGLLMGWMRYRSGSIIPGVTVHLLNNTIAFGLGWLYPESYDMTMIDFFGGETWRLALAVLLSLCLFIPSLYQLNKQFFIR